MPDGNRLSAPTGRKRPASGPRSPRVPETSAWPRTRCRTRSSRRSSTGHATGFPPTPAAGWRRPPAARRLTGSAGTRSARTRWHCSPRPRRGPLPAEPRTARPRPAAREPAGRRAAPAGWSGGAGEPDAGGADRRADDELLSLAFACCHPALTTEAQVALTLRAVCGLTTSSIAAAFLVSEPTMAQRILRARKTLSALRAPVTIPDPDELAGSRRCSPWSTWCSTRDTWRVLAASPPAVTWLPRRSR